jgi:hypothetical protein
MEGISMKSLLLRLFAVVFCASLVLSPMGASAENEHVTAAIKETHEAVVEGRQQLYSSFIEHATNALDHAKEAIASGHNPKWGAARLGETAGCGNLNRNRRYESDQGREG